MKKGRFFRGLVVSLATLGVCLPEVVIAATPQPQMPAVVDIALADGGVLHGQVVDLQGSGVTGVPVSVKDTKPRRGECHHDRRWPFHRARTQGRRLSGCRGPGPTGPGSLSLVDLQGGSAFRAKRRHRLYPIRRSKNVAGQSHRDRRRSCHCGRRAGGRGQLQAVQPVSNVSLK